MRVNMVAAVISHTTASALRFCVTKQLVDQDALTTAWFLDFMNEWYDVMMRDAYRLHCFMEFRV
jgi:hypothetical protein